MKHIFSVLCAVGAASTMMVAAHAATIVTITNVVRAQGLKRIGLGMGGYLEASPFLKNIIPAPGFEPGHFAEVILVTNGSTGTKIKQKYTGGLAVQPPGFWNGARYEIVYGPAKGRNGTVASFTHEGEYTFNLDTNGIAPVASDVAVVDMDIPGFKGDTNVVVAEARPGSSGVQSYRLVPGGSVYYSVDTLSKVLKPSAGKMFLVKGNWRIEFWARSSRAGTPMAVKFFRGGVSFIDATVTLSAYWQKYVVNGYVAPGADPYATGSNPNVDFTAIYGGPLGTYALLDDLSVRCADNTNPTDFSDTYVGKLMDLRPGILRFWGGQMGANLDSMIADSFGRRTVGYQPDDNTPATYTFGFKDLLELCKVVGAEPWWVVPTALTSQDFSRLVEYLAGPADGAHPYADQRAAMGQVQPWTELFDKIHLEFGNEIWGGGGLGDPFRGSSVGGGVREGAIAHYRFATVKNSPFYNSNKFNLIVGGQQGYPGQNNYIESNGSNHTEMAISTYFYNCDTGTTDEDLWLSLYAWPYYLTQAGNHSQTWAIIQAKKRGTGWATYEMDFSSSGALGSATKNLLLTGAGGGIALPLHAIMNQRSFNARHQCAFSEFGFEYADGSRLHGVFRDFEGTGRMRPKGYACAAANQGILRTMLDTRQSGDNPGWTQSAINGIGAPTPMSYINSFAYRESNAWSAIIFNCHLTNYLPVQLSLPVEPDNLATWTVMTSGNIRDHNEDALNVTNVTTQITNFANNFQVTLHPYSLNVFTWYAAGTPHAPSNLTVTASPGGADLAWSDTSDNETGFVIERATDWGGYPVPVSWQSIGTAGSNALAYTDTGAGAGVPCWYRVRASGPAGNSDAAEARRVITGGGAAPTAPLNFTAAPDSSRAVVLAWTDTSTNEDGFAIELAYDILSASSHWDEVARVMPDRTSFHLERLTPNMRYAVRVKTFNTIGSSGYATAWFVSQPGYQPTNMPFNLQPENGRVNETRTPTLTGTDYRDALGGTSHVASQWQVSLFEDFPATVWDSGEDTAHLTAAVVPTNSLTYGLRYYWRVRYKTSGSTWTPWSTPTWFRTEKQTQIITLTAMQNAYIRSGYISNNYNGGVLGNFSGLTPSGVMAGLVLAKFNLVAYAGGTAVGDSDFSNGITWGEHPFDVALYNLGRKDWSENSATWQNYVDSTVGGAGYTNVVGAKMGTTAVGNLNGPYHWPVTRAIIQRWLDHPGTNFGVALGSRYANSLFFTRTYYNASLRPTLTIALQAGSTVGTPTNTSPASGATAQPLMATLAASPFVHPNNGHALSQWQISTTTNFTVPRWDSGMDGVHLASITVPTGTLELVTRYYWRVRYEDNDPLDPDWSAWSSPTWFETVPEPVGLCLAISGILFGRRVFNRPPPACN